jgi:Uma2 family endonuclease
MTARSGLEATVRDAELRSVPRAEQIMSMPLMRRRRWSAAEVERLVDEREGLTPRYELVDGELLVTPAPSVRHQRLVLGLTRALTAYLMREKVGEIRLGPGELMLVAGERYEPDLFVVPATDGRLPASDAPSVRPLLICEVLSPGSSRHDRITKRRAFQANAVPEYWIIDGDAEAIEVYRPRDERAALIDDRLAWRPDAATSAFELDVKAFFAAAVDDAPLP